MYLVPTSNIAWPLDVCSVQTETRTRASAALIPTTRSSAALATSTSEPPSQPSLVGSYCCGDPAAGIPWGLLTAVDYFCNVLLGHWSDRMVKREPSRMAAISESPKP